jgi:hypothetical protein
VANSKNPMDWKWLTTTVLAMGILALMMWTISREVTRLTQVIDSADKRMARVETAVHLLAGTQDEKTRRAIDMALTVSQNSADSGAEFIGTVKESIAGGDTLRASQAAASARTLILTAKDLKTPAPPGYFQQVTATLDSLGTVADSDISRELFATRVALAEYHSALEMIPEIPDKPVLLEVRAGQPMDGARLAHGGVYRPTTQVLLPARVDLNAPGAVIDGSQLVSGTEVLKPTVSFAEGGNVFSGLTFEGVTQTIDGAQWKDVVFVNARIRYRGGRLELDHVRFVNCTFEVSQSDHGTQFAKQIALGIDAITIG